MCYATFARQLERELAAAKQYVKVANEHLNAAPRPSEAPLTDAEADARLKKLCDETHPPLLLGVLKGELLVAWRHADNARLSSTVVTAAQTADEALENLYRNLVQIQEVTDLYVGDQAVEHMYEASKRAVVAFMDYKKWLREGVAKMLLDTGKGCSICGHTPVVNVSGTYWLCGGCVDEKSAVPSATLTTGKKDG